MYTVLLDIFTIISISPISFGYACTTELVTASQIGGSDLKIQENSLVGLLFEKGQHIRINLQLAHKDYCSMEVKAYVNKK